ncbi:2-C-methyl-D-erythritol 4-phosphate cytidylyltransferase [Candidatus Bipolaricaulota bacterium]|nr:2-C-methyl-D-erythritol 4-phosphate cytidylyltransferase [Candidatus Bipolaricaulota bacterium]
MRECQASGVILAAGRGVRFGAAVNKAFVELSGKPLLRWSVEAFLAAGVVQELVVVVGPGEGGKVEGVLSDVRIPYKVVLGGERRQDSSFSGAQAAQGEYVLVHDAARPLVAPELIRRVFDATLKHGAAVPVVPVRDTLRYVESGFLSGELVDREGLCAVQTPQGFRRDLLLWALESANERGLSLTDDATALLVVGKRVATVPGDVRNIKITYPEDLKVALAFLSSGG